MDDFNLIYGKKVSDIVEETYKNEASFVSAYAFAPDKVFRKVASKLNPVPYNLKEILFNGFKFLSQNPKGGGDKTA